MQAGWFTISLDLIHLSQAFRRQDEDRPPAAGVLLERVGSAADPGGVLRARRRQRTEEVALYFVMKRNNWLIILNFDKGSCGR